MLPNYEISWSTGATGLTQDNLAAGSYTITIKDALGCVKEMTFKIDPVPALVLNPIVKSLSDFLYYFLINLIFSFPALSM